MSWLGSCVGFHGRKQQTHATTHIEANSADTNMITVYAAAAAAAAADNDGASQVRGGDLRVWRNLPPRFVDYFRTFLKQHAEKTWLVSFTFPVVSRAGGHVAVRPAM
jgi:hypothetical protein